LRGVAKRCELTNTGDDRRGSHRSDAVQLGGLLGARVGSYVRVDLLVALS
jgi:hypothetical protein